MKTTENRNTEKKTFFLYIWEEKGKTITGGLNATFTCLEDAKRFLSCIPSNLFYNLVSSGKTVMTNKQ